MLLNSVAYVGIKLSNSPWSHILSSTRREYFHTAVSHHLWGSCKVAGAWCVLRLQCTGWMCSVLFCSQKRENLLRSCELCYGWLKLAAQPPSKRRMHGKYFPRYVLTALLQGTSLSCHISLVVASVLEHPDILIGSCLSIQLVGYSLIPG